MDLSQFSPGSALITVILLALAPFVAVMVTSFTKIVVTLSLLRNALGLQQVPPNIVLNGLALILTLYVMYPVGQQMAAANQGVKPIAAVSSDTQALFTYADKAKEPLREFLIKHSTPRERAFFLKTAQRINGPETARALTQRDFIVVVPAFTVSELAAAFQIGFLIFLPFLIIDLVVSNILLAMGMMMLSPTTVSLPFKLLLFVLIDGWVKLAHGLVLSYT
ncbi:EscR/YscR/HrcR family type III secretion system export apparatus protein [Caulobacter sp. D4A]|uniref:type III secretion system export apparatus subunit SctR n=1 Tax=unclassified Caulobacter TaxID=2648921 RepID=UPI000D73396E|nr:MULTISPECIES: type III secretion system export apparatus subunit SctR [unclassified Caulobacter]PXA87599.1 EscR/YscR/HrcR family type III secretion system export apparatus protein [Caulobacter sp. D4A]PXA89605.1 EscR/YscR/HrcR family type III secretion system export apparatus protein [Caulobacter sp. D5]